MINFVLHNEVGEQNYIVRCLTFQKLLLRVMLPHIVWLLYTASLTHLVMLS